MLVRSIAAGSLLTVWFCLVLCCVKCESNTSRVPSKADDSIPDYCRGVNSDNTSNEENSRRKRSSGAEDYRYHSVLNTTTTVPLETTTLFDIDRFSPEFLECMKWKIEKGCYEILSNGSAFVTIYSKSFNDSNYYVEQGGGLLVCSSSVTIEDVPKFDPAFDIVSIVGLAISMICIVLHMIMFSLVPSLRNLPGYCVVSLCTSLLMSYSIMFLRLTIDEKQDCTGLGMGIMYFMLTAFFWMNVLSYDVWRSMRLATAKLRVPTNLWMRFGAYSLYAWGGPILLIVIAIVIDKTGDVPTEYRLVFNQLTCWFEYRQALLMYFVTPMFFLLFCNLIFFLWSFVMIYSASMKNSENNSVLTTRFGVFLKLFVIMGLSWIFGSVAAATDLMVFWYLFAIANCLQGVLIFFSFSFGLKTKTAWKRFLSRRKNSASVPPVSLHNRQPR